MSSIVIYWRKDCNLCHQLMTLLDFYKTNYSTVEVGKDISEYEYKYQFNKTSVPTFVVNDEVIGGYEQALKWNALHA